MALEILRDPRVRKVAWRDLIALRKGELAWELLLGAPWLLGSLALAHYGWIPLAMALSFVFFLVGLRVAHDAFHHNLGVGRLSHDAILVVFGLLMFNSMHAVRFHHLRHHKHCLGEEDLEAMSAKMSWWKAILMGPVFTWRLHVEALRKGDATTRRWVVLELASIALALVLIFFVADVSALKYHAAAMLLGQCLTSFFAVWTVHHDCDRSHFIARTIRGRFRSIVTFEMFYHVEHHLFPKVPTRRLPTLARRLDELAPELQQKRVF